MTDRNVRGHWTSSSSLSRYIGAHIHTYVCVCTIQPPHCTCIPKPSYTHIIYTKFILIYTHTMYSKLHTIIDKRCKCAQTPQTQTHTHILKHTHSHTQSHTHDSHTQAHKQMLTQKHTHTRVHTEIHTYVHTETYTHKSWITLLWTIDA